MLSGGGARGIAHVGVLTAIAEAGIPVDYVCGTSIGSIFAAGLALGWSVERIQREVRHLFRLPFALYDFTVPISSLLAGRKLDRVLHGLLGDADIEDLWLPFFCVSTDLSQAIGARARVLVEERSRLELDPGDVPAAADGRAHARRRGPHGQPAAPRSGCSTGAPTARSMRLVTITPANSSHSTAGCSFPTNERRARRNHDVAHDARQCACKPQGTLLGSRAEPETARCDTAFTSPAHR